MERSLSARHIETLTERVGAELAEERDELARLWEEHQPPESPLPIPPQAVAVAVDDGKVRIRAEGQGPGVHHPRWRNDKVACLMNVLPKEEAEDPMPAPPRTFTERRSVEKLVRELGRIRSAPTPPTDDDADPSPQKPTKKESKPARPSAPTILARSCVATHTHPETFGALVAAEAQLRRFFEAARAIFLGDGSHGNWTLQELYFPDWMTLLDFIHLLEHLYPAAKAIAPDHHWPVYLRLLKLAWAGKSRQLLQTLETNAREKGTPPKNAPDSDPRKILADTVTYVRNNQRRMDYPEARRLGLPITTSHVESLINTINFRVKSCTKFWCPENVEAVLQVRAACVSTTNRWPAFWNSRGAKYLGRIRPRRRIAS